MKRIVIDNSVAMTWAFEDEADRYCERVLKSLSDTAALVPQVWPLEVANVLCAAERRKRITRGDALRFLQLLGQLPITVAESPDRGNIQSLYLLAADYNLSAYDASYLQLALAEGIPLATRDTALCKAIKKAGGHIFK